MRPVWHGVGSWTQAAIAALASARGSSRSATGSRAARAVATRGAARVRVQAGDDGRARGRGGRARPRGRSRRPPALVRGGARVLAGRRRAPDAAAGAVRRPGSRRSSSRTSATSPASGPTARRWCRCSSPRWWWSPWSSASLGAADPARGPAPGSVRSSAPVAAYMVVIGAMVATALAVGNPLAAVGAVLFAASDSMIAWDRFVGSVRRVGRVDHGHLPPGPGRARRVAAALSVGGHPRSVRS